MVRNVSIVRKDNHMEACKDLDNLKTEDRILEAALEIVQEKTISGTRMHLIAKRANIVQSNIHYYYKTKKDLMLALQNKVLSRCMELRKETKERSPDTLEAELDVFIRQKVDFIIKEKKYDYAELDFWVQSRISEEIKKGFQNSFHNWRREITAMLEKYVPELSKEKKTYLPYMMVSFLEGASIQYLIEESFDLEEYMNFCKQNILQLIKE